MGWLISLFYYGLVNLISVWLIYKDEKVNASFSIYPSTMEHSSLTLFQSYFFCVTKYHLNRFIHDDEIGLANMASFN